MDDDRDQASYLWLCCRPFISGDEDSDEESVGKFVLLPLLWASVLSLFLLSVIDLILVEYNGFVIKMLAVLYLSSIQLYRYLRRTHSGSSTVVSSDLGVTIQLLVALILCVVLVDLQSYGVHSFWVCLVLLTNVAVVLRLSDKTLTALQVGSILFFVLKAAEDAFELGLYFIPSSISRPPPLDLKDSLYRCYVQIFIFLTNLAILRRFTREMNNECASARDVFQAVESLLEALVKYDLESVDEDLRNKNLPGELQISFRQLISNLRKYRPYLPRTVVGDVEKIMTSGLTSTFSDVPPPGEGQPDASVAIVFTDIQSSTSLWDTCSSSMRSAMVVHNNIMRTNLQLIAGYEVKTVGDSFMAAFPTAHSACRFALLTQEGLYDATWPAEIMGNRICRHEDGLWNGLRVRMGIHYGPADLQINPVTSRADYFGPTVNMAARVEGSAPGGLIYITETVLTEVGEAGLASMGSPTVVFVGSVVLRGFVDHVDLHALLPKKLESRAAVIKASRDSAPDSPIERLPRIVEQGIEQDINTCRGTVACVRVQSSLLDPLGAGSYFDDILQSVVDAAARTDGSISSVSYPTITLTWNTAHPTSAHALEALRFVGHLARALLEQAVGTSHIHLGLATGTIQHGTLGTSTQRFATAVGPPIEVAGLLAERAQELGTIALIGADSESKCAAHDPLAARIIYEVGTKLIPCWGHTKLFRAERDDVIAWITRGRVFEIPSMVIDTAESCSSMDTV
eukprot:Sspe_Gene.22963::Locus_8842_Transcript_1_1_Confidence_1.000_Length_2312::g.22963::m.22963